MKSTDFTSVKRVLDMVFRIFGDPGTIVSDNGPPFTSNEFLRYCELKEISVLKSPPYHPQSNGIAERAVQTFKIQMNKLALAHGHLPLALRRDVSGGLPSSTHS